MGPWLLLLATVATPHTHHVQHNIHHMQHNIPHTHNIPTTTTYSEPPQTTNHPPADQHHPCGSRRSAHRDTPAVTSLAANKISPLASPVAIALIGKSLGPIRARSNHFDPLYRTSRRSQPVARKISAPPATPRGGGSKKTGEMSSIPDRPAPQLARRPLCVRACRSGWMKRACKEGFARHMRVQRRRSQRLWVCASVCANPARSLAEHSQSAHTLRMSGSRTHKLALGMT